MNFFQVLHKFSQILNIVQATINQSRTLLGYVTKSRLLPDENISENDSKTESETSPLADNLEVYRLWVLELCTDDKNIRNLELERSKQARIQFLYKERLQRDSDKFLVLIHQECKFLH